ncbi:glycosyltransferase, partial [Gluconobacter kondonii]|uniref:glycosyltransferase n=1 Tax=Gluconobacter kondonii TaxID=941463 RepID=UPI001B8D5197
YPNQLTGNGITELLSKPEGFSNPPGFGLPPVEAMEAGCPVVARDIPVLREVCGQAALFGRDPSDLTARVVELLDQPNRANDLRCAGYEQVQKYRWTIAARQLLDIMREEFIKC